EWLPSRGDERLEHHAHDRAVPGGDLGGDVQHHVGLASVILSAVVVRGVDDDALGEPGAAQTGERLRHRGRVVVRFTATAAQDDVAILVAARVHGRRRAGVVDPSEHVRRGGGANRVHRDAHVSGLVEIGVVDHALPTRGRAGLLEVHAHDAAEVVAQLGRLLAQALRVVEGGLDVVDAAGPDDDHQAVVSAVEDSLYLLTA